MIDYATPPAPEVEAVPYHEILDLPVGGYWWGEDDEDPSNKVSQHLTLIGDVELAEPDYSFDLLRFWVRPADGAVLYATDSGCSCPSPFDSTYVRDLKETTLAGVQDVALAHAHSDGWYGRATALVARDASDLLGRMTEAGAR